MGIGYGNPITFVDEGGVQYGIKQVDGKPRVSCIPYTYDIAEGNVTNHFAMHQFGRNPIVGTDDEPLWDVSSTTYNYLTTAVSIYVSSSDSGDTTQEINVEGLDANYDPQTATANLNGQNQVVVGNAGETWIRTFLVYNDSSTNFAGDIYVTDALNVSSGIPDTLGSVLLKAVAADNHSLQSMYTVPAGLRAYITDWVLTTTRVRTADSQLAASIHA